MFGLSLPIEWQGPYVFELEFLVYRHIHTICALLIFLGSQVVTLAALSAQTNSNPLRQSYSSSAMRHASDNPLRDSQSTNGPQGVDSMRPRVGVRSVPPISTASRSNAGVRLVQFEEDIELSGPTNSLPLPDREQDFQPDEPLESNPDSELVAEDTTDQLLRRSDVRAPLQNNPFKDARQSDPNGLLVEAQGQAPKFTVERYANISGREGSSIVAGYNAHRFKHNPLYFEEPNLERYGNELEFQRLSSALRFFSGVATLPMKIMQSPPCSKVTTLGFRRPGELVPCYRRYHDWSPGAGSFSR